MSLPTLVLKPPQLPDLVKEHVLKYVLAQYILAMIEWVKTYVPRKTGRLQEEILDVILRSDVDAFLVGAPTEYAAYVNAMEPPINWTNPNSVYHFYEKMLDFANEVIIKFTFEALEDLIK